MRVFGSFKYAMYTSYLHTSMRHDFRPHSLRKGNTSNLSTYLLFFPAIFLILIVWLVFMYLITYSHSFVGNFCMKGNLSHIYIFLQTSSLFPPSSSSSSCDSSEDQRFDLFPCFFSSSSSYAPFFNPPLTNPTGTLPSKKNHIKISMVRSKRDIRKRRKPRTQIGQAHCRNKTQSLKKLNYIVMTNMMR